MADLRDEMGSDVNDLAISIGDPTGNRTLGVAFLRSASRARKTMINGFNE